MNAGAPQRSSTRRGGAAKYRQTLSFMVDVLDDGLRLYRQHFWSFVLLAAAALTPLALSARLVVWLSRASTAGWAWALIAIWPLVSLLLGVYWVGSLSRATVAALGGQPIDARRALAIGPRRALRGCSYALLRGLRALAYYLVVAVSALCALGAVLFVVGFSLSVALRVAGAAQPTIDALTTALFLVGGFGLAVIIGGMPLANIAFGLQPWLQDERPLLGARKRGAEVWRDGDEDGMYFVAALAVLCMGAVVAVSLIAVLALPAWSLPAPLATLAFVAALVAAVVVLPLLPIWMALLYRKLAIDADGRELGSRIAAWRNRIGVS